MHHVVWECSLYNDLRKRLLHGLEVPGPVHYGAGGVNFGLNGMDYTRGCGWESLMKSVTLGNVTMSHRTRERPAECLASLSHSTMIGLPRAQH
ncbi:hypothetical protein EVAR_31190_1 [Eumeta japonica]|uniref:Uncharacterized protein n=1 Tax=Eumeta variegata TaxID=151549 RepID=A0A4C1VVP3_EUMVA|nr:hypothetical protein EVAR_31190_1 [Eumeta japonica]